MAATHVFKLNEHGTPITIVIGKIISIKRDEFSDCTSIVLEGGTKYGVSETVEQVTRIVEDANRT